MSAGGVFKIITNDGKADQMLMATQLLKDRICDIIDAREAAGLEDTLPTLKDIEKTHILHFQSKFKPFAALGYEYQKVKPQSGVVQFSSSGSAPTGVTYSLPQFGDFLSDSVFNAVLTSTSYAAAALTAAYPNAINPSVGSTDTSPAASTNAANVTITYPDGSTSNSIENVSVNGTLRGVVRQLIPKAFVDDQGNQLITTNGGAGAPAYTNAANVNAVASIVADRAFYCEYPGERFFVTTKFDVNGNPLDNYDVTSYVWYRKFRLPVDKYNAYYRNVGQERAIMSTTNPIAGTWRRQGAILNGAQTPKTVQPPQSWWAKLLFWFNLDHSQSLVSAAIPYGQRFIDIGLASDNDLVFRGPACYLQSILVTRIAAGAIPASGGNPTNFDLSGAALNPVGTAGSTLISMTRQVMLTPVFTNGAYTPPTIQNIDLYINNIFTIPEIHDIYIERIGFSLIRVHRIQTNSITTPTAEIQLTQFKYPVEFFFMALRPDSNYKGVNRDTDWWRMTYLTRIQNINSGLKVVDNYGDYTNTTVTYTPNTNQNQGNDRIMNVSSNDVWELQQRTIETVSVTAHGVALYNNLDSAFFNQYLPENYGYGALVTPDDQGALFINFCLHPYAQQPSGHLNTSRAREFFVQITSNIIAAAASPVQHQWGQTYAAPTVSTATFLAEASALNFLLITDGSAVLRYTT